MSRCKGAARFIGVVVLLLMGCWAGAAERDAAQVLHLQPIGTPRKLPDRILGASVEPFFEHILDDPAKIAVAREMDLGFIRFPGGTQSNYYNWRSGQLELKASANSSAYTRYWVGIIPKINAAFPRGITFQQYMAFSQKINAVPILVPNLETSTVDEQVAWFKQLKADGVAPQYVELGNEFWVAMADDLDVIRKWPDEASSMAVMRQYADAIRPYLPKSALLAVQSAGSAFSVREKPIMAFGKRLRQWDDDLHPEPWFDAVTIHLYPEVAEVMGPPRVTKMPDDSAGLEKVFSAMMARCDEGVDRVLDDVAHRLPGKEIWITEWSPRGATVTNPIGEMPASMKMQLATRMTLAYLRHPEVTASLYFMLNFTPRSNFHLMELDGKGGYKPTPIAVALRWLDEAANGGTTYQQILERGARKLPGAGHRPESYFGVEGAVFRTQSRTVLILQNATGDGRKVDISEVMRPSPRWAESVTFGTFFDGRAEANVGTTDLSKGLTVPPYSLCRVVWE